jgi:hypothetical protein
MTIEINTERAVELLEEAVKAKGTEHVVFQCQYFSDETGDPLCIVGYGLHSLGITLPDLIPTSTDGAAANGTDIEELKVTGVEFTNDAREVLSVAQGAQDYGESWGTALDQAKERAYTLTEEKK